MTSATIPYTPRAHFLPLHASPKRWIFIVAHRRAGKTVALANTLIQAALTNPRKDPAPRYAYIGPSFDQVKDLVWQYLKFYTATIPGMRYLEGELAVIFPNGARIQLYGGGTAYERLRGLYLDGAVLDEYPLLNPLAFTSVVRPALADYSGFAVVGGTSNGDDAFHALKLRAEDDPERWDVFDIKISDTAEDALSSAEVEEMRKDMSPDEFAREMMNSFEAPIEGAYYSDALTQLALANRIVDVHPDLSLPVHTGWDLGMHDFMCIWLFQLVGREYHWLDYIEGRGKGFDFYVAALNGKANASGFHYGNHLLPHDVSVREMGAMGKSRRQSLTELLPEDQSVIAIPPHNPDDGIKIVRSILGISWFDLSHTRKGLSRLRAYRKNKMGKPLHDDASHGADAFRTASMGVPMIANIGRSPGQGPLRRRIRGLC